MLTDEVMAAIAALSGQERVASYNERRPRARPRARPLSPARAAAVPRDPTRVLLHALGGRRRAGPAWPARTARSCPPLALAAVALVAGALASSPATCLIGLASADARPHERGRRADPVNLRRHRGPDGVGGGWCDGPVPTTSPRPEVRPDARPGAYRLEPPGPPPAVPSLDEHQRRVVDHPGGPLLVLAGPGTGKTTTLVEAIVDRVEQRGASPESVLALTFSRKAAEQLRDRVTARLGRTTATTLSATFHSFAYGLVRRYAPAELYAAPLRLLSAPESDVVLRELLTRHAESVALAAGPASARWAPGASPARSPRCWPGRARGASTGRT